jgi:hypothetical protein
MSLAREPVSNGSIGPTRRLASDCVRRIPSGASCSSRDRWEFPGAHAAAFSALVPASHRLDVRLGGATVSDDLFPLTDGGELPADR